MIHLKIGVCLDTELFAPNLAVQIIDSDDEAYLSDLSEDARCGVLERRHEELQAYNEMQRLVAERDKACLDGVCASTGPPSVPRQPVHGEPRHPFQGSAHSPLSTSAPAYPDTPFWHSDSDDADYVDGWRRVPPELQHLDDPDLIVDSTDEDRLDGLSEDERCDLLEERYDAVRMLPVEQRYVALQRVVKEQWTERHFL